MTVLRRFLSWNLRLSDRLYGLAERRTGRRCGLSAFRHEILPALLAPGLRVLDVGGGKWPLIDAQTRTRLGLTVTGLDVSAEELAQAPAGCYDRTVVGDVATVAIPGRYDLILSQTVLEHVCDTPAAIANLSAVLAEGGVMAHFVPCAYAGYTFVSRLLGNRLGRKILWTVYPDSRSTSGFRAYYRECTPRRMRRLCRQSGLDVVELRPYFASEYFRFFAPLYALEMLRQLLLMRLRAESLCEAFTIVARKPAAVSGRVDPASAGAAGPVRTSPARAGRTPCSRL